MSKDTIFLDLTNEFPNILSFLGFSSRVIAFPAFQHISSLQLRWQEYLDIELASIGPGPQFGSRGARGKLIVPRPRIANDMAAAVSSQGRKALPITNAIFSMDSLEELVFVYGETNHGCLRREMLERLKDAVMKQQNAEREGKEFVVDVQSVTSCTNNGYTPNAGLMWEGETGEKKCLKLKWILVSRLNEKEEKSWRSRKPIRL